MRRKQMCVRAAAMAVLVGLALVGPSGPEARAQERGVVVIANSSVPDTTLDRRTLSNIFLDKKTSWSNRDSITIVTLADGQVHEEFLRDIVGKTPKQYSSYWARLIFTGSGRAPRSFKSERDVVSYVASVRGAVGYVSAGTNIAGAKRIVVQD